MSVRSDILKRIKKSLSAFLALALALSACLCLSACGGQTAASITVRLTGILGDTARNGIYRDVLTGFSKAHPNVYLRDITTDAEDAFKLELNIAGSYSKSDSPHIIYYYNNADMRQLSDYFVSVQEIREDIPDFLPDIGDNALENACWDDGMTYCIPVMGEWYAIAVNKVIFAKYGLEMPYDWTSLLSAADALSANNIIPFANTAEDSAVIIESLVRSVGGQSALRYGVEGDADVLDDVWARALTCYQELCRKNAFAPSAYTSAISAYAPEPSVYDTVLGETRDKTRRLDPSELFESGRAAMMALDRGTFMALGNRGDAELIDLPTAGMESASAIAAAPANETPSAVYSPVPSGMSAAPGGSVVSPSGVSSSDTDSGTQEDDIPAAQPAVSLPDRLYGGYTEGFYITRKAYTDPSLRPLIAELITSFASAETGERFAALGYLVSNTKANAQLPQLGQTFEAAAAGASYLQSTTGGVNSARWSYIQQCAVQLWYGLITPQRMAGLLAEESRSAIDVLEQLQEDEQPRENGQDAVSSSDGG